MRRESMTYAGEFPRLDRGDSDRFGEEYLPHPEKRRYLLVKTVIEWVAALGLVVLTAPVMVLAGLLIKAVSRGPMVYAQTRLGRYGRPYTIYKIRTMYHECEKTSGARWAIPNDPRIMPLGRFLRAIHVDELPQLWNVLRGEMSLIGPRPERPEFVSQLERALPSYSLRLVVRPGLTGLAQVQLPADTDLNSVRRKLAYDLYYIRMMSPWLDLRILAGTAFKMIGVSFSSLRRLLLIPTEEMVERVYPTEAPRGSVLTRREVA